MCSRWFDFAYTSFQVSVCAVNILQSVFVSKYLPSMTSMNVGTEGAKVFVSFLLELQFC